MTTLLRAENLVKIYHQHQPDEVRAVRDVSVAVQSGEVLVLRGPSGSGKTSLLSLLGCMARPTSGRLFFADQDVTRLPEHFLAGIRQQSFGFIFQQFNLVRELSVIDNVLLPLYPTRLGFAEMKRRATEILAQLHIDQRRNFKVAQLSGGEQQRVAIARALINHPPLIIADEPTAHLDSQLAAQLMEILTELHQAGKTLIIASHDPFVCDHPLISRRLNLHDGQLQEPGA